ncbi:Lrp/AsnC family transcriptional regulator [Bradyrhizobium sp.]|uniref:Lrp/AsnC family transcriptional regulator n=1 Tax=Bradyrhizobium sp. TaxID=376 RepID=UPI0039E28A2E
MTIPANTANFDAIDLKILRELQADARLPNNVLAERVGLSPSPCSRRVRLLEETGAIEGYRTIVNRSSVGLGLTVFAGIRVGRHSAEGKENFIRLLLAMPEVIACHLVSGDIDFLIEVVVRDMVTYEATVLNRLLSLPELRDIRTSFAMRTYRSSGPLPLSPGSEQAPGRRPDA